MSPPIKNGELCDNDTIPVADAETIIVPVTVWGKRIWRYVCGYAIFIYTYGNCISCIAAWKIFLAGARKAFILPFCLHILSTFQSGFSYHQAVRFRTERLCRNQGG